MKITAAQKITTFLMFEGCAQGPEGSIQHATFTLAGQQFMCIDSPMGHQFGFTPAVSLFVQCASDEEIDRLYAALAQGGQELMTLGDYGFSEKFGWVNDRYGVSWQLNR